MTNSELEGVLQKLRQLFAAEYNRGEQDAIQRIMQAAASPSKTANNGHDAKETQPRENTIGSRAPRGSVDALIKRVLTERGSQGAGAKEIHESAHENVSYSGVRFALDRGREDGLYRNEGGRWFLKGAAGLKAHS